MTNKSKHIQFSKNLFLNGVLFVINAIIGLWLTPFLITKMGIEAYGMVPLSNQITSYLSLLTIVLTGAVGRFLSIEIINENKSEANKIFNTTFFASLFLVLLILPFIMIFLIKLPTIINVPLGYEQDTKILFGLIILVSFVTFLETSFLVSSWSTNRLDLRNLAIIVGKLAQVIFIIVGYIVFKPSLWIFGVSLLLSYLVAFIGHLIIWKKQTPYLIISPKYFDKRFLAELTGMGKWIFVDQIGILLFLSSDLFLVNQLLGPTIGGQYGSIIIIPQTLRIFIVVLNGTISPLQMEKFAKNDYTGMLRISSGTIKTLGLSLALIVGLICGFSKEILTIWLGNDFVHLWKLMIIMLVPVLLTVPFQPLLQLQVAYKKVKLPSIITLFLGIFNIGLAILLVRVFDFGVESIVISFGVTYILRTTVFSPIYGAHIQGLPIFTFINQLGAGVILFLFVFAFVSIGHYIVQVDSIVANLGILMATVILGLLLSYFLYTNTEREFIRNLAKNARLKTA